MPLQATSGAASYDAFGGGVPVVPNYIEDVFSTYLYDGNGGSHVINNGIDLSGKGGLVWFKARTLSYNEGSVWDNGNHLLMDTSRGVDSGLSSNLTNGAQTEASHLSSFNSNGFTLGGNWAPDEYGYPYASWTFRKQPKFFDVVTYTGTGSNTTIAHSLGSVPGSIFVKRTNTTGAWQVYHRSLANTEYLVLNTTAAKATGATRWNSTTPTSTVFSLGTDATVNASGGTYVAYIFAHDAGGFGLTGTDNVISCGSMVTSTPLVSVNLGYEPQWVMWKRTDATGNWGIADNMRGMPVSGDDQVLIPNLANAEALSTRVAPNATGFTFDGGVADGSTFIYIAIRRGPMKVPTSGTSVFAPIARAGTSAATSIGGGSFTTDTIIAKSRGTAGTPFIWASRLTGTLYLDSTSTNAQSGSVGTFPTNATWDIQQGIKIGGGPDINDSADTYINYFLGRAPSVFDVVAYTGTGTATTVTHNLGVAPELMIVKSRSSAQSWPVYNTTLGNTNRVFLNGNAQAGSTTDWNNTTPTASVFSLGTGATVNGSAATYVAYLFATCAGVSKVGTYTGTGTTLQVNCGFTAGARFVLIRRTSFGGGDWYVWDTARGIVSGNDPYLLLNSTAAEVTNTDYIDTYSAGFELSSTAPAAINASGSTYIFLAIA
jgi:hypothetical protein